MKKYALLTVLCLMLFASSCSKEDMIEIEPIDKNMYNPHANNKEPDDIRDWDKQYTIP